MDAEQQLCAKPVFQDLEASKNDVAAWEARMEEERSVGQFFKQLYVDPKRTQGSSNASATTEVSHNRARGG